MEFEYDKNVDAAYIYFKHPLKDGECARTVELNQNIVLDFDESDKLVGVEILNASELLSKDVLQEAVVS